MTLPPELAAWLATIVGTPFAGALGEMALFYLGWDLRLRQAEQLAAAQGWSRCGHRRADDKDDKKSNSVFAAAETLQAEFIGAFMAEHRDWAKEDVAAASRMLFARCTTLIDWMRVLVTIYGIVLEFEDREPRIALARAAGWDALADKFDPDALVCFLLAESSRADQVGSLTEWGITTRIGDGDLKALLDDGVTDLHVHLGGFRSAQLLWRNIVTSGMRLQQVDIFAPKSMQRLRKDPEEHAARLRERDRIMDLIGLLEDPASHLGTFWRRLPDPNSESQAGEGLRAAIDDRRLRERMMLAEAWQTLLHPGRQADAALGELEFQLDQYLSAKNLFLGRHRQPRATNPGLGAFREYFHATSPVWPSGKLAPARFQQSRRVVQRTLAEYAAHIAQSRALQRVELRLSPYDSPRAYEDMFRAWSAVEAEFELDKRAVDIRFGVHFLRSLKTDQRKDRPPRTPLLDFLALLDRQSGTLHRYRTEPGWSHAGRISRIDFAGQERDLPPDAAGFCMKLVRGDDEAVAALQADGCDPDLHRYWLWHAERGTALRSLGRPNIGLTCHAGEDYAHPLEGIHAVVSAVSLLRMRPGDTIGHGLALGQDIEAYDRARSPRVLTTRGRQFDALLWLYLECRRDTDLAAPSLLVLLESWLRSEADSLYRRAAGQLPSLGSLEPLFEERCKPVAVIGSRPSMFCARLRLLELRDAGCAGRRAEPAPIAEIVYALRPTIVKLQKIVLKQLAEKGVALEFNPSSNLRVSASASAQDIPFMKILEVMRTQVLATVNTDNPGTFGTRIENEYAMVMQALGDAGFTRAERLDVIVRLRDVGRRLVLWPSAGQTP